METQRCGHCREEKDMSEFAPSYRGRPGTWCRACMRARYKPHPRPSKDVPEGHLFCTHCKTIKPKDQFGAPGVTNWCKECRHDYHRERYAPKPGVTDEPRACAVCGKTYQPKHRIASIYCSKKCQQEDRKISGRLREGHLRRKYGIDAAEYDRLLAEQAGGCALCGIKPEELAAGRYRTYLHVDHDHETGRVRGLLCPEHNLLLGRFGDSVEMFRKVVAYLEAPVSV